jgi:hypothetical protein
MGRTPARVLTLRCSDQLGDCGSEGASTDVAGRAARHEGRGAPFLVATPAADPASHPDEIPAAPAGDSDDLSAVAAPRRGVVGRAAGRRGMGRIARRARCLTWSSVAYTKRSPHRTSTGAHPTPVCPPGERRLLVDIGRRPILNAADWALKRDPVPKPAEKEPQFANIATTIAKSRSLRICRVSASLEGFQPTTENRGVPGSSPGLAIGQRPAILPFPQLARRDAGPAQTLTWSPSMVLGRRLPSAALLGGWWQSRAHDRSRLLAGVAQQAWCVLACACHRDLGIVRRRTAWAEARRRRAARGKRCPPPTARRLGGSRARS